MTTKKARCRAASTVEAMILHMVKQHHFNEEKAAALVPAFLELNAPIYVTNRFLSKEVLAQKNLVRGREALKLLRKIEIIQEKTSRYVSAHKYRQYDGYKNIKRPLWEALIIAVLTEGIPDEDFLYLASGLLNTFCESTHGEDKALDATLREQFKEWSVRRPLLRLGCMAQEGKNPTVVNRLGHAISNHADSKAISEMSKLILSTDKV